ncbi:hypothetical protein [Nocardia otitidiscaviarum]|uniref:hypothetical protein n=1 Tax=Nocardia otitidiscaviarum TaxID=1823 RepID=UPI0011DCFA45|nr:hypothetical protein [Nocardia otitidiscaviarum]
MAGTAILAVRITGDGSGAQTAMRRTADAARRMASNVVTAGAAALFVARNISTISTVARYGGIALALLARRAIASSAALRFAAGAAGAMASRARAVAAALFAILPGPVRAALIRFAAALRLVGHEASRAARDIARLASAILVLRAVAGALGKVVALYRALTLITLASVPLIGVLSAVAVSAAALVGAFAIAAAGAVGTLFPALAAAKMGFKGLSDGAKEFNKQFRDADTAFNKIIGQRMEPFLTAMRDLKQSVTDSFSSALIPAFGQLGGMLRGLQPQMAALASTLGTMFSGIAERLPTDAMAKMVANSDRFVATAGTGVAGLVAGFAKLGATASTAFANLGPQAGAALESIGAKLAAISPEQVERAFATLSNTVRNIGNVLDPVVSLMAQIGPIATQAMGPAFVAIGAAINQATPGLARMAETVMPALSQSLQNLAPIIPALANAFSPWVVVLSAAAPSLASMATALAPIAPALVAIAIATKIALAAQAAYNTVMLLYSRAGQIATAVQWAWNIAMSANPIGLIIVAVVALIAVIVLIATKTTWFQTIWQAMSSAAVAAWNWIRDAALTVWQAIVSAVQTAVGFVSAIVGAVVGAIVGYWHRVSAAWSAVWAVISAVVSAVTAAISAVISAAIDQAISVFQTFQSIGSSVFDAVRSAVDLVGGAINTVISFVQRLISAISSIKFPSPPSWLTSVFGGPTPELVGVPSYSDIVRFLPPVFDRYAAPGPELTAASPSLLGWAGGAGSLTAPQITNVTITVEGAVDPQATALQIERLLRGRNVTVGASAAIDLRV